MVLMQMKGGFGVVYKATMNDPSISPTPIVVAIKEIQKAEECGDFEEENDGKLHEFQHEMLIMRYVRM